MMVVAMVAGGWTKMKPHSMFGPKRPLQSQGEETRLEYIRYAGLNSPFCFSLVGGWSSNL